MTETAARLRRTPSDWLSASLQPATLLGLMMIVACWIGFAFIISLERGKSLDTAINQSAHLVRLFEENTIRTLQGIDRTLLLLRKAFEDDPKHFNLAQWTERTALIGDLTIQLSMIGSDGFMTASTTGYGGPPIYLGDREHFRAQIDAKNDELFISKPVLGRASGMWSIQLSRRVRQHDGDFGGVIVASIDPDFIDRFFQSVDLGSHGAVTLRSLDGVILASRGTSGRAVGRQIVPQALREALTRGRTGHYWGGGAFDGVNRLVTFRVSTEYPLIVSVGLADSDIVQSYQRNRTIYLTIAIIITLLVLIVIWIGIRHQIGLVRVRDDLRRSEATARTKARDLELKSRELEVTLDNITHGLCMFDAEKRLVVCNDRYAKIYNLPAKLLQAGTSHEAIIAHRVLNGVLAGDKTEDAVERKLTTLRGLPGDVSSSRIDELADGRLICVTRQPMVGGGWVATHQDITEQRRSEAKIAFMAHHDTLTGLANRTLLMDKIEEAGARQRRRGGGFAVFMLDLDRFKQVNDSLGHPAGDALLVETGRRLKSSLRETDVLARFGGDEFAIIQPGEANLREAAAVLAQRIINVITQPYDLDGSRVTIGTSIGIALAPEHGIEPGDLIKKADLALYRTKSEGRNGVRFFDDRMTEVADTRHQLENDLRDAISGDKLELHYQAIVDVKTCTPLWGGGISSLAPPAEGIYSPRSVHSAR